MKKLVVLLLIVFSGVPSFAQTNTFQSMYMYDALAVNPAYAGNKGAAVINANYRDQWGGINGSPATFSVSGHLLTRSRKTGLGILVQNDKFGLMSNTKLNLVYAYKLRFKASEVSLGVAGGLRDETFNRDELSLNEVSDDAFSLIPDRTIAPDVTAGVMFRKEKFIAGLSAPNLVRLKSSASGQAVNLYTAAILNAGAAWKIKPSVLVKYISSSPLVAEANITAYYSRFISFGIGARNEGSGNFHLRAQLNRQFAAGYLYERNFGPYNQFLRNTHEFMISYTFDYKTNVQNPRYL